MKQELAQAAIYKKLLEIKKKVPYLKKDKAGFNYKYTTPTAVLGTINPLMNEAGLLLITEVVDSKSYAIQVATKNGPKTEWKYDLKFIFKWVDVETGEFVSIPFEASGVNGEDKGLGSALTYAERYFLLKQFNIPTDSDDPDSFQDKYGAGPASEGHPDIYPAWQTAVNACETVEKLQELWEGNKATCENDPKIKTMFANRKKELK